MFCVQAPNNNVINHLISLFPYVLSIKAVKNTEKLMQGKLVRTRQSIPSSSETGRFDQQHMMLGQNHHSMENQKRT